jgi:hypothetical protein
MKMTLHCLLCACSEDLWRVHIKTMHVMTVSQKIAELQQCSASRAVKHSDFVLSGALTASCFSLRG